MYEGRIQPDEFINWLKTFERVFEYQDVLEEEKVKLLPSNWKICINLVGAAENEASPWG
jgi:hypothetical protein